jgi:hypothetical protein
VPWPLSEAPRHFSPLPLLNPKIEIATLRFTALLTPLFFILLCEKSRAASENSLPLRVR